MIVHKRSIVAALAILLMAFCDPSATAQIADSATVRIQIDVDSARLVVDSLVVASDAFGSSLTKDAPFILNLASGTHNFVFSHPRYDSLFQTIDLAPGEVRVLEISLLALDTAAGPPFVEIISTPDSGSIRVDDTTVAELTPHNLELSIGERRVQVSREGYEPLTHSMTFLPGQRFVLDFKLMAVPPVDVTADSLGLTLMPQLILDNPERADILERKYTGLAETFFIIPFFQGIAARSLLSKEDRSTADVLIISGAVLVAGSYMAGKIISRKLRSKIEMYNETARIENSRAKENNRDVEREVKRINDAAMEQWQLDNMDKGEVIVTPIKSPVPSDTPTDSTGLGTPQ